MPKKLSTEQIARYHNDGYLSPINVMTTGEAKVLLDQLTMSERLQQGELTKGRNFKPHLIFQWADRLVRHPAILDAVEDLIGPNIRVLSTTVFPKKAGDGAFVGWHQDGTYFGLVPNNVEVAAWVALSDASIESGCMEMQVGSHKLGQLHHSETSDAQHMLSLGQTVAEEYQRGASNFTPLRAGEMSLHHTHTIHRSGPNKAQHRRVGVTLTYIPAEASVRGGLKPSAALVRGADHWHTFEDEPRPQFDMGPDELKFQAYANELFRAVYNQEKKIYERTSA